MSHRIRRPVSGSILSLGGRRVSVTWQLSATANQRRPHQPPREEQPEGAELRRRRLRRQRWRRLRRPQSASRLRPVPHHGDARRAAGAAGRATGHGLGLLRQHRRTRRGVLLRAGHLGHQDGPHLRGGGGRLPGHRRGGAGALPAVGAAPLGRSGGWRVPGRARALCGTAFAGARAGEGLRRRPSRSPPTGPGRAAWEALVFPSGFGLRSELGCGLGLSFRFVPQRPRVSSGGSGSALFSVRKDSRAAWRGNKL